MKQKKVSSLSVSAQSGQAMIVGLMVLVVASVISFGVLLIRESMAKQRRLLRVQISKNALVQEIEYILKNPLSYSDYANLVLNPDVLNIVNNMSRKIAGLPCGDSGDECKIVGKYLSSDVGARTVNYQVEFLGTSPRIKVMDYSTALSGVNPLSNKICSDPNNPILEQIDSAGNAVCRPLLNTTCAAGEYLIGIGSNLTALCTAIEDRSISVPPDRYIKSYKWNKNGNSLTLSAEGALRALSNVVSVANSFELGPISFWPRPGTDIIGPTVNNIYFPRKDSALFKCPTAYPLISFKSVTGSEGLSCGQYTLNTSTAYYQCAYAQGDWTQREVRLTYVCSKNP